MVTGVPFWIERRGSSERIKALLEYLKTFCDVTVCYLGELDIRQWNQSRRQLGFDLIGPGAPGKLASAIVDRLGVLMPPMRPDVPATGHPPGKLEDFHSEVISDFVVREVAIRKPDFVILEYVTLSYLCDRFDRVGATAVRDDRQS